MVFGKNVWGNESMNVKVEKIHVKPQSCLSFRIWVLFRRGNGYEKHWLRELP